MRGRYAVTFDVAREARSRGIPFGKLNDPVGQPVERGLAVIEHAIGLGKGQDFVASFLRGVWSQGADAGSDKGLRKLVEAAGLDWAEAQKALFNSTWRQIAEANRAEMFSLGLWGVPSFRVGQTVVWGQDRLWAVQAALNLG